MKIDFVGRSRTWAVLSGTLIALSLFGLTVPQLDFSIDFVGGSSYVLEGIDAGVTADQLRSAAEDAGATDVVAQVRLEDGAASGALVRTAAIDPGSDLDVQVTDRLVEVSGAEDIQETFVGPTWGERISRKALEALLVFLVVVALYISFRLELKMAGAAVVALVHDIIITAGIYALVGFTVSPATVIAFLTILGYSLYDTVVVFDRIQENAPLLAAPGRPGLRIRGSYATYGDVVNSSMNQVLTRSLNTSLTSLLPVGSLLFIGSQLLGATTLQDLALALFVGMAVGTYSSLFVAAPFLAWWKQQEPEMRRLVAKARAGAQDDRDGGTPDQDDEEEVSGGVRQRGRRPRRKR